ncbi:MAG: 3-deoxy-7-phosphoheptulonate synthase [Prochloron sp. SP5CPC1]|nr:3-deoxy-7-phosphoheptulonate synthase [Candidatus Paraprochloron terpiosi SP5CPC1]
MIIVMKQEASELDVVAVCSRADQFGFEAYPVKNLERTIITLTGINRSVSKDDISGLPGIECIFDTRPPAYERARRESLKQKTTIKIFPGVVIGEGLSIIAGPCSVESREQVIGIAQQVKSCGADALRGGIFKPRSLPYRFNGIGERGLEYLHEVREATGLPIVTEVLATNMVEKVAEVADVIQVGTRSMRNADLLTELGRTQVPVLLKRGMAATIEELLMAAEYIMAPGNPNVILCERGIRTFEKYTRNTLDLNAIPAIKKLSHLPVVVDPSHGTGRREMVLPMARAAVACGADGLLIEVHNNPNYSVTDSKQAITPEMFGQLVREARAIHQLIYTNSEEN